MKVTAIISQAEAYLNSDKRKLKAKIQYLKQVLKALSKREKKLQKRLEEGEGNKKKMQEELTLIHAQRSKGVKLHKQLKAEHKARKKTRKSKDGKSE